MKLLYEIIYTTIGVVSTIYIWYKLINKRIDFKDYKLYITLVSLIAIAIINCSISTKFFKIIIFTIVLMMFFKYLFNSNIQKTIIVPIYHQFIVMISETLFVLFLTIVFNYNAEVFVSTYLGTLLTNVVVSTISVIIVHLKITKKIYRKIIGFTDKIKTIQLLLFFMSMMAFVNIFAMTVYYKIDFKYQLLFNSIMIIACFLIVIYTLKTKNKYNKVYDKYNVAINSLNDYETMMTKYRISNHENKNLLLTIRAMILNKEKDIPKYIDSMIEEKYEDNEKLLYKMSVIPSGGLRATIYSEILKIQNNKIDYFLDIDSKLKTIDLIELDTNDILNVCKIISVFIDNAIDAVKSLKSKNIQISLYLNKNELNIKVSNNYSGKIELEKIFDEGYTTKSDGHGYGLALVKEIINNNSIFKNNVEISKNVFSQILIIKSKKN